MQKREDLVNAEFESTMPSSRRHKRHHHRKHKRRKPNTGDPAELDAPDVASTATANADNNDGDSDAVDVVNDDEPNESSGGLLPTILEGAPSIPSTSATSTATAAATAAAAKRKRGRTNKADSGTSSGEERWLDAIESGKLEQVDDEMRKLKDPKLMTARQRAMYERNAGPQSADGGLTIAAAATAVAERDPSAAALPDDHLFALPSGYKEVKVLSAEDMEKALLKSQKRKQLADEKREKNKRKTMERLLKKKDYKATVKANKTRVATAEVAMISWRSSVALGTTITFPVGVELPAVLQQPKSPQKPKETGGRVSCTICGEPKRYNCSRTHVPLCSFECYKQNVEALKQIMC